MPCPHIFGLQDGARKRTHVHIFFRNRCGVLNKLDNVDEAKERRYRKYMQSSEDFNFMIENCIDTTLTNEGFEQAQRNKQVARPDLSLAYGSRIAESFKYKAIEYNINILNSFSAAKSFNEMLVDLSGEKNWKNSGNISAPLKNTIYIRASCRRLS